MKKQVIINILEKLEGFKKQNQFFVTQTKAPQHIKTIWNAKTEAYEKAIEVCLKEAGILDLRPSK